MFWCFLLRIQGNDTRATESKNINFFSSSVFGVCNVYEIIYLYKIDYLYKIEPTKAI